MLRDEHGNPVGVTGSSHDITARKQVDSARPQGSDSALALAALEQANAGLQAARARLAYTRIVAPVAGTLIARHVEHGDVVQPGRTLMVLAPAGETQIVVQVAFMEWTGDGRLRRRPGPLRSFHATMRVISRT